MFNVHVDLILNDKKAAAAAEAASNNHIGESNVSSTINTMTQCDERNISDTEHKNVECAHNSMAKRRERKKKERTIQIEHGFSSTP